MFSFRTTSIEDQLDRALTGGGLVGCFCTPNCWDAQKERYLYDIFRERGNLGPVFSPSQPELSYKTSHIEFSAEQLSGLNAIVVEIQDVGSRYFNYTRDVFHLMEVLSGMENPPSLYIVDHVNPAGRAVEGTMPSGTAHPSMAKVAHRHALTLGELAYLYLNEIGGKFPLHVISAAASESSRLLMPWTISPSSDITGLFTCDMYSGGGLWNNTNISPGIGTSRPYEYIGAPFLTPSQYQELPVVQGVRMRPCSFIPADGPYAGKQCFGYQIILEPGTEYHSLLHTLQLMRYFRKNCPAFGLGPGFEAQLADGVLMDYIASAVSFDELREHIKVEEQKWIRKAKKFLLYDEQPYRIK